MHHAQKVVASIAVIGCASVVQAADRSEIPCEKLFGDLAREVLVATSLEKLNLHMSCKVEEEGRAAIGHKQVVIVEYSGDACEALIDDVNEMLRPKKLEIRGNRSVVKFPPLRDNERRQPGRANVSAVSPPEQGTAADGVRIKCAARNAFGPRLSIGVRWTHDSREITNACGGR